MANISQADLEIIATTSSAKVSQADLEVITTTNAARVSQANLEIFAVRDANISQAVLEVICQVPLNGWRMGVLAFN